MEDKTFSGLNKKPRSQKGWQEWNRKYALAFLSDQLDRTVHSAAKRDQVTSLLTKWEQSFRAECAKEKPDKEVGNAHNLVEDQIDFITNYIGCALCDGTSRQHLDRIKHFLAMQTVQNVGDRMELRFIGGSPIEAYAYVDSLEDIDIADAFFITNFDFMSAYRPKIRPWTARSSKDFFNAVKKDVLFDMGSAIVDICDDIADNCVLAISIGVDKAALNIKMLQCMPPAFVERFK